MGLVFNLDTDTVKGPSESLYCRIDQITIEFLSGVSHITTNKGFMNDF